MSNYDDQIVETSKEPPPSNEVNLNFEEESSDEGDSWLVSYADMMTLICCFFILMMAFSNFDQPTFKRVARQVEKYFKGANLMVEKDENLELAAKIETISQLNEQLNVMATGGGIEIRFNSAFLFESGEAELKTDSIEILNLLTNAIKEKKQDYIIEVHGHTDGVPLSNRLRFKDNWELSSARAANVVKKFIERGFSPKILSAIGHADSRPEVVEYDGNGTVNPEAQKRNRRVFIQVRDVYKSEKIGLGLEFEKDKKERQQPTSN